MIRYLQLGRSCGCLQLRGEYKHITIPGVPDVRCLCPAACNTPHVRENKILQPPLTSSFTRSRCANKYSNFPDPARVTNCDCAALSVMRFP